MIQIHGEILRLIFDKTERDRERQKQRQVEKERQTERVEMKDKKLNQIILGLQDLEWLYLGW